MIGGLIFEDLILELPDLIPLLLGLIFKFLVLSSEDIILLLQGLDLLLELLKAIGAHSHRFRRHWPLLVLIYPTWNCLITHYGWLRS